MYVDALFANRESKVKVVERVNGKRVYKEYPGIFEFYVDDAKGRFRSIHGTPVTRIQCDSWGEFQKAKRINSHKNTYESDIKPVNKIIEARKRAAKIRLLKKLESFELVQPELLILKFVTKFEKKIK